MVIGRLRTTGRDAKRVAHVVRVLSRYGFSEFVTVTRWSFLKLRRTGFKLV